MRATHRISVLAVVTLLASQVFAQEPPNKASAAPPETAGRQWSFSFTADGYVVPQDQSYISPTFTADHQWLHLEARYNYEDLETGSLWVGYNFSAGHKLMLNVTPMIGGVFGKTTGVAPGDEVSLSFKKLELSSQGEFVFDTKDSSGSFFYAWSQVTYSPLDWFNIGLAAQRTKAYHTQFDVQRGLLVGFSHKKVHFTTYVFNLGWTKPTVVFEMGVGF